jgi:hypothetical protein
MRVFTRRARTLIDGARGRIIDEWRRGLRFWSVRLQAAAVASGTLIVAAPDALVEAWHAIPPDLRAILPGQAARWLPILFGMLAILARFVRQKPPRHDR